jgi:hypothetical protein
MEFLNSMKLDFNRNYLSPRRLVATISAILTLYSFARVGVLFFEAIAIVREERSQDYELLELCSRGDARSSPKMREACLQARADRASPLLAKAIVHAVSTAFKDFSAMVGSPFKFSVVVLFIISSVVLPVIPWARALIGTSHRRFQNDDATCSSRSHFIVMAPSTSSSRRSKLKRALGRHIPMLRNKPSIHEVAEDGNCTQEDYEDYEEDDYHSSSYNNGYFNSHSNEHQQAHENHADHQHAD